MMLPYCAAVVHVLASNTASGRHTLHDNASDGHDVLPYILHISLYLYTGSPYT